MMKNRISKIIKKYLSSRFSPQTENKVQRWLIEDNNAEEKEQASLEYWNELKVKVDSNTYSALDRVNQRIGIQKQSFKTSFYKQLGRIAAVLIPLFLIAGAYFYISSNENNMIEIHTAYGDEKHILLPDSSEIWINAGSTIKYPRKFEGEQRTVYLDGEAYFSVQKNEAKPFVVKTKQLLVKVLGTKFNVKAYNNDKRVTTTLTSGKVEVDANKTINILKPNEQLIYNRDALTVSIEKIPSDETDGWVAGQIIFNDASLGEIIQTLERRFDISIVNNTAIPFSKIYTVKFLKGETSEQILDILQDVVGFSYQKKGDKFILNKIL